MGGGGGRMIIRWKVICIFLITALYLLGSYDNDELSTVNLGQLKKMQGLQAEERETTAATRTTEPPSSPNKPMANNNNSNSTTFVATPGNQFEMCFVTSVYAPSTREGDRPPSVEAIQEQNPTFRFFAFTNLPDLQAPGWNVMVKKFSQYKRSITQSRWAKFMAWTDPTISKCQAVIYMDGFCKPKEKHSALYKQLAREIAASEFGLFQNRHEVDLGPLVELDRIVKKHKDIQKNVDASIAWLLSQPDFQRNITMYVNTFIGYNPKSPHFREAAQFFWDHYSLEQDSWRDQPLWAYTLHKFKIRPKRLGTFKALFLQIFRNMGRGGHRYNETANVNADEN
eukprot:scaffold22715_cov128-Cylindrotheca_fusiformis.AAC.3